MNDLYTIGLDYGTLSCRGVLVRTADGCIAAEASFPYPHGVLDSSLPHGAPLPPDWCLQHPRDYVDALEHIVPQLLRDGGIPPAQVVGIGVDFTASTVLPVDKAMVPLCLKDEYAGRPHAWVKLWKHHGAAQQAARLQAVCERLAPEFLAAYGGTISSECLLAKVLQVWEEDPQVFAAADCFMEAGDYVTSLLAGRPVFAAPALAAKAFWSRENGYPGPAFFEALSPALAHLPREKLAAKFPAVSIAAPGEKAGGLCEAMAKKLGLLPGIAVTAFQMDSYAPVAGVGIDAPGTMLLTIGTSTGILLLSDTSRPVEGVTASLPDTVYPGYRVYASGQASVGDGFAWFARSCVPEKYQTAADEKGLSLQQYLTQLAAPLAPGETGLLALDWFNGNRSRLGNSRLSAMVLGLTLQTRPEHIYRALLEATAFGVRQILEAHTEAGVPIDALVACGGVAEKNPLLMQIYADVLHRPLQVSTCSQAPALGAAIYAAAAAGERTGHSSIAAAVQAMGDRRRITYTPNAAAQEEYESLYREYSRLYDYFGRGENPVMDVLSARRRAQKA